jgi:hypothetical protein
MTLDRDMQRVTDAIVASVGPVLSAPIEELPEFLYAHLSQCVLSAVWSLNRNASAERNVVNRYVAYAGLPFSRPSRATMLDMANQQPLDAFCRDIECVGVERFAVDVVKNRQRTSARSGILKKPRLSIASPLCSWHMACATYRRSPASWMIPRLSETFGASPVRPMARTISLVRPVA